MNAEIKHIDRDLFPPTLVTEFGAAWEVDIAKSRELAGEPEDKDSTVAMWIVFAPWAHPFWAYYLIGAIHLRDIPGLKPADIRLKGATHEILVFALAPDNVPETVNTARNKKLRPINFAGQWIVNQRPNPVDLDRAAVEDVRETVDDILTGRLSPDTDFRQAWVNRFSDSNVMQ